MQFLKIPCLHQQRDYSVGMDEEGANALRAQLDEKFPPPVAPPDEDAPAKTKKAKPGP